MIKTSPYVEECLQSLNESGESPNDKIAVALCKVQIISENIHDSLLHDKNTSSGISPTTMFIINSFEVQLKQFYEDLSPELKENG